MESSVSASMERRRTRAQILLGGFSTLPVPVGGASGAGGEDDAAADDDDVRSTCSCRSARSGISAYSRQIRRGASAVSEFSAVQSATSPFRLVSPSSGTLLEGVHKAAFLGDEELLARCLHEESEATTRASVDGWLPLHYAAEHGHITCAEQLLAANANVDARGRDGWTALMWAARRGHEPMVELLLEVGADTALVHLKGWTALHLAAACGHTKICRRLVGAGADVFAVTQKRATALHLAVSQRRQSVTRLLLQLLAATYGADPTDFVERRDVTGSTALHVAAQADCPWPIFELLLEYGANRAATDMAGRNALAVYERRPLAPAGGAQGAAAAARELERNRVRSLLAVRRADDDGDASRVGNLWAELRGLPTEQVVNFLKERLREPLQSLPPDGYEGSERARAAAAAEVAEAAAHRRAVRLLLCALLPSRYSMDDEGAAPELLATPRRAASTSISPLGGTTAPFYSPLTPTAAGRSGGGGAGCGESPYVPYSAASAAGATPDGSASEMACNAAAIRAGNLLMRLGAGAGGGGACTDGGGSGGAAKRDLDAAMVAVTAAAAAATAAALAAGVSAKEAAEARSALDSPSRFSNALSSPAQFSSRKGGGERGGEHGGWGGDDDEGDEERRAEARRRRGGMGVLLALCCGLCLLAMALIALTTNAACMLSETLRPQRCAALGVAAADGNGGGGSLDPTLRRQVAHAVALEVSRGAANAAEFNCTAPSEGDAWLSSHPRGALYVFQAGRWGTVCVHGFDRFQTFQAVYPAASIVCEQLGYTGRSAAFVGARRNSLDPTGANSGGDGRGRRLRGAAVNDTAAAATRADADDGFGVAPAATAPASGGLVVVPMHSQWAHCAGSESALTRCGTDRWVFSNQAASDAPKCEDHAEDVILQCQGLQADDDDRSAEGRAASVRACGSRQHRNARHPRYDTADSWIGAQAAAAALATSSAGRVDAVATEVAASSARAEPRAERLRAGAAGARHELGTLGLAGALVVTALAAARRARAALPTAPAASSAAGAAGFEML